MPSSLVYGKYLVCGVDADGRAQIIENGALIHQDGQIVDVGTAAELRARHTPDEEIGSSGHMVLPGLINAHHHVGLTPFQLGNLDLPLETWIAERKGTRYVDPYLDTLYCALQMIESGITTVMHNGAGSGVRITALGDRMQHAHEVLRGYEESGMRVAFSPAFRDQNQIVYQDDAQFLATLPRSLAQHLEAELQAMAISWEDYITQFAQLFDAHGRNERERVRLLLSPANVQWCSDAALQGMKEAAARYNTGLHIHLMESVYQKQYGIQTWGVTPLRHLYDLGFLGPEVSCAHGVWLTEQDMELLAETGTVVCHNASSNLRLKSGIAPVNRMVQKGVTVAIGIDEAGINDDNDILQEMRLVAKLHREPGVAAPQPSSSQVLRMATVNGATATLFGARIGTLEVGARADVVLVNLEHIVEPYLDPNTDMVDALLYRGRGLDVDTVIVDGEVLLRGRRFTRVDRDAVVAQLKESLAQELTEEERTRQRIAQELLPYVQRFYEAYPPEQGKPHYLYNRSC